MADKKDVGVAGTPGTRLPVPGFSDSLGSRVIVRGSGGVTEMLRVSPDIASLPSFEAAVRDGINRLASFAHPSSARVRRLERATDGQAGFVLDSEYVEGNRLSEMLLITEHQHAQINTSAVLDILQHVVSVVAGLQDHVFGGFHGVLGPERIVIRPDARVVVVEQVFGPALRRLPDRSPADIWEQLQLAVPSDPTLPRFGPRTDLVQIGVTAVSLLLGRMLRPQEYPERLTELLDSATESDLVGNLRPLSQELRAWIAAMLQLDPEKRFRSIVEARQGLDALMSEESQYIAAPIALDELLRPRHHRIRVVKKTVPKAARPTPATVAPADDSLLSPNLAGSAPIAPTPVPGRAHLESDDRPLGGGTVDVFPLIEVDESLAAASRPSTAPLDESVAEAAEQPRPTPDHLVEATAEPSPILADDRPAAISESPWAAADTSATATAEPATFPAAESLVADADGSAPPPAEPSPAQPEAHVASSERPTSWLESPQGTPEPQSVTFEPAATALEPPDVPVESPAVSAGSAAVQSDEPVEEPASRASATDGWASLAATVRAAAARVTGHATTASSEREAEPGHTADGQIHARSGVEPTAHQLESDTASSALADLLAHPTVADGAPRVTDVLLGSGAPAAPDDAITPFGVPHPSEPEAAALEAPGPDDEVLANPEPLPEDVTAVNTVAERLMAMADQAPPPPPPVPAPPSPVSFKSWPTLSGPSATSTATPAAPPVPRSNEPAGAPPGPPPFEGFNRYGEGPTEYDSRSPFQLSSTHQVRFDALNSGPASLSADDALDDDVQMPREATTRHADLRSADEDVPAATRTRSRTTVASRRAEPGSSKRTLVVAILVVFVVAVAGGGAFWWMSRSGDVPTGTLVITSEPSGTEVRIDGETMGMTPVTLTLPAGSHEIEARGIGGPRTATVEVVAGQSVSQSFAFGIESLSGSLNVTSRIAKVEVLVDGESKGMAPLTVENLPLGIHTVTLRGPKGETQHEVTIEAAKTARLDTADTGWVTLQSPINLQVQEKGVVLGTAAGGPIALSPGVHRLDFRNAELAYRGSQVVQVESGRTAVVTVEPPMGSVNLTSKPPSEVYVDGVHVGATPVTSLSLPLGPHEVSFRSNRLGELRYNIMVTLASPVRMSVDFKK